ncbi:SPARC isoform X2 [Centruroides vittatus]|uniref:SPARC isoform X2 n=1 Tax=Centruroides vittatus TaxID=120091 RepID=UPI00351044A3
MKFIYLLVFSLLILTGLAEENEESKDQIDLIAEDDDTETPKEENPCLKVHCSAGRECEVDDNGKAKCVCVKKCMKEKDERRKVCSNHNETWNSDCELYRMRCICAKNDEECTNKKYKHVHVDYYGSCKEIPECSKEELEDFPRRMREWLFNIMQDLARREELKPPYLELEKEAEISQSRKWVNAVIWKFCDLDSHPHDRSVSRHEFFPIRAPLVSLEHCIAPFLDSCDANDDHKVSLEEWGNCLGLEQSEIEDKCAEIRN